MLKKLDKLYNKILNECICNPQNLDLEIGYWFAPETPFQIKEDMLINGGSLFDYPASWAGKVKEILSENEMIYEVCGKYLENDKFGNFRGIRCKPFLIKYTLTPGESYFIYDNEDPHCEWLKTLFNNIENDNIETEDGECCGGGDAGLTTNAVFGSGSSAGDSLVQNSEKDPNGPGITTHDMRAMYALSLNPKKKKVPTFKRVNIKKNM